MSDAPTGTVTFLFSDIEASTTLWSQDPKAMSPALAMHDAAMREAVGSNRGFVFKTIGDAFCSAFPTAADALAAANASQRVLQGDSWSELPLNVRMGIHTGTAEHRDNDYFGTTVNRTARIMSAAHGGQILLSMVTAELLRDQLSLGPPCGIWESIGSKV